MRNILPSSLAICVDLIMILVLQVARIAEPRSFHRIPMSLALRSRQSISIALLRYYVEWRLLITVCDLYICCELGELGECRLPESYLSGSIGMARAVKRFSDTGGESLFPLRAVHQVRYMKMWYLYNAGKYVFLTSGTFWNELERHIT